MVKNKSYRQQLKKMLIIEIIGERLYKALSLKVRDENLKATYQRLARNENQTARYIEEELYLINKKSCLTFKGFIWNLAGIIFILLTAKQIVWILKSTLRRKIYSHWFHLYKDNNQEFWSRLLNHERLQYELLGL